MLIQRIQFLPELVSGRWQPKADGGAGHDPSTALRVVPLPQTSWGRIC
jgi:hypothetical protein